MKNEVAVIETRLGKIVLEFFPEVAPKHVANFKKLAESGFYDSTTFHRVIPGFIIQGGDPLSKDDNRANDGTGGPGYTIVAEPNEHQHLRGAVSMARKGEDSESNGSQFYICVATQPHLDKLGFTVFANVLSGMDTVDKIVNLPRDQRDNPLEPISIEKVSIILKTDLN
ncbi:peptidylprolyl isomerase [candidate division LCP-89 bacterium B3_LCP]|uniref:Peptidyl-prolyl cis-trans isomerase n=1 Tax=candidate division LCP-89 bacterium B3_LCP TaxID=2012998 RepID=A0A532UW39_UNCL8|nr:MAG: peptidylprolyl isomerase [candidate division LCP-89 bacterium B3_LCP]